ncbi:hypothetical protein GZ78_04285 [Endozoicomonas numazuensis]|uniref:Uncharacterized protein n=1 Tax=Endozoicomonas numazuensis TaxID=1137799 RepID=A0A081NL95_9GAMM|nr:hypothetical protein GZ78_04285 [Endozoicomonas numazuensis]
MLINIPIAFQDATLLPAFAHPDHLLLVGSQGFAHSILKSNGYKDLLQAQTKLNLCSASLKKV